MIRNKKYKNLNSFHLSKKVEATIHILCSSDKEIHGSNLRLSRKNLSYYLILANKLGKKITRKLNFDFSKFIYLTFFKHLSKVYYNN